MLKQDLNSHQNQYRSPSKLRAGLEAAAQMTACIYTNS